MMAVDSIEILSSVIGYTYTILWTASFYPQFVLNIQRKTTQGFSPDFTLLNVLGMSSYAIHNCVLAFSPLVRDQYAQRHPSSPGPLVQLNDVAYAVHGALITSVIYTQFYPQLWGFKQVEGQKTRPGVGSLLIFWGCIVLVACGSLVVLFGSNSQTWEWLDVIYLLGTVKAVLTVVKYTPQVWLNYRRKSTGGLSILQFTLDLGGALLSILQLVIDSAHAGAWSNVLGNPVKLALGNATLLFDLAFYVQHFYLYRNAENGRSTDVAILPEEQPLLTASASPN
ncbi:putative cystinosin [Xylaria arbuscula]|nr:putative cystinosin [Xylaria arbuscula]